MLKSLKKYSWYTVPNFLSSSRIIIAPFLILMAYRGWRTLFFIFFAVSLLTDALDGYLARKLNQTSELGSKLDGWADLVTWITALICFFILWPELAKREVFYAIFAISVYILPVVIGFLKYKSVPIYHCYSAKFQAIFMSVSVFIMLLTGNSICFRCAAITQSFAALEDIAITLLLPRCYHNVLSFWHAKKIINKY